MNESLKLMTHWIGIVAQWPGSHWCHLVPWVTLVPGGSLAASFPIQFPENAQEKAPPPTWSLRWSFMLLLQSGPPWLLLLSGE